jgi:hypothetical protein
MAVPVDLAVVADLIDQLKAVPGVRSASMDPAELQTTPAVWVQLRGIAQPFLAASEIRLYVHLISGDTDGGMRVAAELVTLYNSILEVVTPDGETETLSVTMPDGAQLPALRMPVDIPNTPPATP